MNYVGLNQFCFSSIAMTSKTQRKQTNSDNEYYEHWPNTDKQGEKDPLCFLCPTALHPTYLLIFSELLVSKKHQHEMHMMVVHNGINILSSK